VENQKIQGIWYFSVISHLVLLQRQSIIKFKIFCYGTRDLWFFSRFCCFDVLFTSAQKSKSCTEEVGIPPPKLGKLMTP
jgi:hypothetical protein